METTSNDSFNAAMAPESERPQFLKILCILSFVACGLLILVCALGTMFLAVDSDMVDKIWGQMIESNPAFEDIEPMEFFHQFGMVCLYTLIATIFSLVGVIMMWRLEKLGFFIYAAAELVTHFFSMDIKMNEAEKSYGGMIFFIIIDLIFIGMYFMNLKYMNKNTNNTFIQSGS